jgi:aspartate carbamoyltransferase catalytic subunit
MKNYRDVMLYFVAPEGFRMRNDILEFLGRQGIPFEETEDFESVMSKADAIYMTRIQNEYAADPTSDAETFPDFHFKTEHLKRIHAHCAILHPLPRRYEIDVAVDKDPRAAYWRQERCGMWIRTALIAYIFGVDQEILAEFD